jgi:DNA helicase-2/ATP-dependent DNA helicase PcrA
MNINTLERLRHVVNHPILWSMMTAPILHDDSPAYLNGLNEAQLRAVETLDGPVLMLAGAGTGKTRALTARLAHLIHTGRAYPSQILAVTFTNKAAAEMKHRVAGLLGGADVAGWWMGTFHSIAARMLRRHAELVGLTSNYTIIDEDDALRLMKQIFADNNIDAKTINPAMIMSLIDDWKNRGLRPSEVNEQRELPLSFDKVVSLYQQYQDRLITLNACDFGDLLMHLVVIFKNPDNGVLAQYHARLKYILVDEYQDTNNVQYQWLRLLAQASRNICCVGDDDQSIYGWRGANVNNILGFEKDFPEAQIVRLERNYRSTQNILNAANALIAHNKGRLGKNLFTEAAGGEPVRVTAMMDNFDEARQISDEIESVQRRGVSPDNIAILVRTAMQMRSFEDKFNQYGIRYRVVGGPRFYERAEIRDALAYLRLVFQGADDLAFQRIINLPKRGLGDKSVSDIRIAARAANISMLNILGDADFIAALRPSNRPTLMHFHADIMRWRGLIDSMSPADLTAQILEESGYFNMWRQDKGIEAAGRIENLKELLNAIAPFPSLGEFLEHVSLVMDTAGKEGDPAVTLMTLHAAKGLEFDHVFLPGWEEGLFPSQRSMDESGLAGLEEERRLAYVGITRARKTAMISYTLSRYMYGTSNNSVPSRFIEELPNAAVKNEQKNMQRAWGVASTSSWGRKAETVAVSTEGFSAGQRVFHEKFGYGKIRAVDGDKLEVSFDKAGDKKLIDRFVVKA